MVQLYKFGISKIMTEYDKTRLRMRNIAKSDPSEMDGFFDMEMTKSPFRRIERTSLEFEFAFKWIQ